jgi:fucose 4-O-acetylase-like acetyltransferase
MEAAASGHGIRHRIDCAEATASARVVGFEAIRAGCMLAVVALHAAMGYTQLKIPGLLWVIREPAAHPVFDWLTWLGVSVSMPLFFLLGGYSAAAVWEKRGAAGYARDRWRRVALPFLAALPVVLVPTLFVWSYGWLVTGRVSDDEFLRLTFTGPGIRANRYGPAHLWFLEYLILMLALYGLARWRFVRPAGSRPATWLLRPWAPLALAAGSTLVLGAGGELFRLDPILDMRNSFLINPLRWLHHAVFFVAGAALHGLRDRMAVPAFRSPRPWLALALAAGLVRGALVTMELQSPLRGPLVWLSASSAAVFAWSTVWAALTWALHARGPVGVLLAKLAGASYWVYLVHFPFLGLFQADLYPVAWLPIEAKFVVSLGVTLAWCLATHWVIVRPTWMGLWLGGGSPRRRTVESPHVSVVAGRPAVAATSGGGRASVES